MNIRPRDIFYGIALLGVGYGLYKLIRGAAIVGEAAGKAVQSATSAYLTFRYGDAVLTEPAKLGQKEMISKGYLEKVYSPFEGCTGDACYKLKITPKGNAYIEAQKKALGIK